MVQVDFKLTGDRPLDYGLSFIQCTHEQNQVRFWVESRMQFIDEKTGKTEDFYQCGACKSENTFSQKDLFKQDNYDFIPVFGPEKGCIFRRNAYLNDGYKINYESTDMWNSQVYHLIATDEYKELQGNEAICKATGEAKPIVARTKLYNQENRLQAIIEYPVKTMNILNSKHLYQVDTGPVLYPDLSGEYLSAVESIHLAFVAFNVPEFADFVMEVPTPIMRDGKEVCKVYHYSKIVSLKAVNSLIALY